MRPPELKDVQLVPVTPPPPEQRVRRLARRPAEGEKPTRYSLPSELRSGTPIGYRRRLPLSSADAQAALNLLSLRRPTGFGPAQPTTDARLFEESALGLFSARQSTNYRGHRQVSLGPDDSARVAALLRQMTGHEAPILDGAARTHLVFARPYRTAFTLLLTFVGHQRWSSPLTVARRLWDKKVHHADDIPTIGFLTHLHVGILADAMERATVLVSAGEERANVLTGAFASPARREANKVPLEALYALCGLTGADRRAGWRLAVVAQIGTALPDERVAIDPDACRHIAANLLAFRSERIQPGVNQEEKAPAAWQTRQDMHVPDALVEQVGRAGYNAFVHHTGLDRERAKATLLFERVDVLTPNGKERLRAIRAHLDAVTDRVVRDLPKWADLPMGRKLSSNAARGKKAFALAGQRVYIGGLSRPEVQAAGLDWEHAVVAFGATAARCCLVAELAGVAELPDDCDLLAGICLMAGPVNQNDIGKQFYGDPDLLEHAFPGRSPTSLLVWTLKAKTIADPVGNEEQLLNPKRQGALVDLRPAPHEVMAVRVGAQVRPFRARDGQTSTERAFATNLLTDPDGAPIPGNAGAPWPWASERVW